MSPGRCGVSQKSKKRRRGHGFRRRAKPGTAPGTITVDPEAPKPVHPARSPGRSARIDEKPLASTGEIRGWLARGRARLGERGRARRRATISEIGEIFGIHRWPSRTW